LEESLCSIVSGVSKASTIALVDENMRKKYIITFIAEFLVMISGILVYKLAAHSLGNIGFSEYALSRRTVNLLQAALLMGLGVGIPRYVAYSSQSSAKNSDFYFAGAVGTLLLVGSMTLSVMLLLKGKVAFLLFGSSDYTYLIFPISLMVIGILSHLTCYTYFQGRLFMVKANVLQIVNIAVGPLAIFLISNNTARILTQLGVFWCITSLICFSYIFNQLRIPELKKNILPYAKEIMMYSLQRVPGDFGMAALLSIAAIMCAHIASVKEAGYFAFGVSILTAGGSVFAPIGVVLLPHASRLVANKQIGVLRSYVGKILKVSLLLAFLGVIFFEIFADKIIGLYLGNSFLEISAMARLIAIGVIPYTIFVTMRSVIDSYHVKALNTKNILISLFFLLTCGGLTVFFSASYKYLVIEFILALFLLGVLTLIEVKRIFKGNI
jgi:O-antigen/teichoic acid export membrane protein